MNKDNYKLNNNLPFLTICMPVRNEENNITSILNELLNQEYPPDFFEIIVADGVSTDKTCDAVMKLAKDNRQIRLLQNPKILSSSGRNVGLKNGKGDIFLIVDGHCLIGNNQLFINVAKCFEIGGVKCLGRPQPWVIPELPNTQKAIALARQSPLGHSLKSYIHSNREGFASPLSMGCAYKREVIEKVGLVDESFDACEDFEFNYRVEKAGFRTFFSPKIAVHYYPRDSYSGLWNQLVRYGTGRIKLLFKHIDTINIETILPALFLIFLLSGLISIFFDFRLFLFYLFFIMVYLAIILWESYRLAEKNNYKFMLKIVISFIVIHTSLGFGLLKGLILETMELFRRKSIF
jgi:glycosyltransferase involved in cell wall biosynthesis